jgi:hypothetical protein
MSRLGFIANLLLAGSFAFSATLSAQTSSIEGNVVGTDGHPLKNVEVRFEQKVVACGVLSACRIE